MEGEHYETMEMYPEFAREAREEGNEEAARLFLQVAKVEKQHRERYRKLLELMKMDAVFQREEAVTWKCSKCGFIHQGKTPPKNCPSCKHPANYFIPDAIF